MIRRVFQYILLLQLITFFIFACDADHHFSKDSLDEHEITSLATIPEHFVDLSDVWPDWEQLIRHASEPLVLDALISRTGSDYSQLENVFANFALFKAREDPENRLADLLDYMLDENLSLNLRLTIADLILDYFDESDCDYIYILFPLASSNDLTIAEELNKILDKFPVLDRNKISIKNAADSKYTVIRVYAAECIGNLAPLIKPEERQFYKQILFQLLADEQINVRVESIKSIARLGSDEDSITQLRNVYDTDIYEAKGEAVLSLARLLPPNEAKILFDNNTAKDDPYIEKYYREANLIINRNRVKILWNKIFPVILIAGAAIILMLLIKRRVSGLSRYINEL
jgi:hypothetical protein